MEPKQPKLRALQTDLSDRPKSPSSSFLPASMQPSRTASSTPTSSPGLFSPSNSRSHTPAQQRSGSEATTPLGETGSPFLHPLQHQVRE